MAKKISQLPVATAFDGTELLEVVQAGASKQAKAGTLVPPGYIDGLKMVWVSGTALTVTTGAAYVPGLGRLLRAAADIAKTGLVLTASTWYHVYLYDNVGTPAVEIVTTAPAAPYSGTARTKTGDTSRRYVGSVLTDASGNIFNFAQYGNDIKYLVDVSITTLLSAGTATASTTVSTSSLVPITSRLAVVFAQNGSPGNAYIGVSDAGALGAAANRVNYLLAGAVYPVEVPLNSSQEFLYMVVSGNSGLTIYLRGYRYDR